MLMLLKTHVAGYVKKDGTAVRPHEDKRTKAPPPRQFGLDLREPTGGDEVVAFPYASGMSRRRDMNASIDAAAGLGTEINELSSPGMDRIAESVAAGKPVFVDSGAFNAFKKAIKQGQPELAQVDFEKVFAKYDDLSDRVCAKAPHENRALLMMVAPDVVGDQVKTLELIERHAERIMRWMDAGHDVIVPFQRGPIDQFEAYLRVREALQDMPFVVGIPSAAAAMTTSDMVQLFGRDYKPDRIHILGAVQSQRFEERMQVIRDQYVDQIPGVTSDANIMRSKLHELGGLTGDAKFAKIKEIVNRATPKLYGGERLNKADDDWRDEEALAKAYVRSHTRAGTKVQAYERRPMYVSRKVLNGADVHDWATKQGFQHVTPPDKMHVTVAYSRTPVVHETVGPDSGTVMAAPVGVAMLGDKDDAAHVLHIDHPRLQSRFKHMIDHGASWDFDANHYRPHVTISYKAQDIDHAKVKPYSGEIHLGPERVEPLKSGWGSSLVGGEEPKLVKADDFGTTVLFGLS